MAKEWGLNLVVGQNKKALDELSLVASRYGGNTASKAHLMMAEIYRYKIMYAKC